MRKFWLHKIRQTKGFISIVAIGILSVLAVFGIIIQLTVLDSFDNVKSTNNYYAARDLADSVIELLQFEMERHGPGYNTPGGEIICTFGSDNDGQQSPFCDSIAEMVGDNEVEVSMEIIGRPSENQKIATEKCGTGGRAGIEFNDSCYVSPLPGTGNAGQECSLYDPVYHGEGGAIVDPSPLGVDNLDHLDHSCNWNKLTFGSSLTDSVAVPLYYDNSAGEEPDYVYPFINGEADDLLVRLRTPCKPCGTPNEAGALPPGTRACIEGQNPTLCSDDDRYVLDDDFEDDIVVEWQITGICEDGQECGLIAVPRGGDAETSALYESKINDSSNRKVVINAFSNRAYSTIQSSSLTLPILNNNVSSLRNMENPLLILFLNRALITRINNLESPVPYLEYQVLTNTPITAPQTTINVAVNVNGNIFQKSLKKAQKKDLIDFAVQN